MLAWALPAWLGGRPKKRSKRASAELRLAAVERRMRRVQARYDAAQTNGDNQRHWAMADGLSARTANSLGIRSILRQRSRYECSNNSYAAGMLLTLANDMVGTGPRLQLDLGRGRQKACRRIEQEFAAWCRAVKLPQKLRTMRISRARDGEVFAVLTNNPALATPVKLDFKLVEADQVTSPQLSEADPLRIDGIRFDEHGNPTAYEILPYHPGDMIAEPNWQPEEHAAANVIHWFRVDRPGQLRGVPEITPALPLFAQLRRYTLAVIAAAETAADLAAVLSTDAAGNEDDDAEAPDAYAEIDIEKRTMLTLPGGYTMQQFKAEQPTTTYGDFKNQILNEIARCLNMPFNVAAGNSAGYNYSSGRLDHQIYFRSIGIDQADCESDVLDRLFAAWLDEAALIPGLIPAGLGPFYLWRHTWAWDPAEDLDPVKTAQARLINLASGMTSFDAEFAAKGLDRETEMSRMAESLGITLPEYQGLLRQKILGDVSAVVLQQEQDNTVNARLRRRVRRLSAMFSKASKAAGSAA